MSELDFVDLLVEPNEAIDRIDGCIDKLAICIGDDSRLADWYDETRAVIDGIFVDGGKKYFTENSGFSFSYVMSKGRRLSAANTDRTLGVLKRLKMQIANAQAGEGEVGGLEPLAVENTNKKIFVVHGHDEAVREKIESVLGKLGLEAIVLNKKANEGLTIIEKLEKHGVVGFAVIALTADDLGGTIGQVQAKNFEKRPRPNVLIELGYFWGKLKRDRICVLSAMGDEIPSDLKGLGYTSLLNGDAWKFELVKELRGAGYAVDANRILE